MDTRRRIILLCAPLALLLVLASCAGGPEPSRESSVGPVVQTRFGAVRGVADADGTWVWRGIPYARAPVGELRWREPRDPEPWEGVRDATRFGGACTQRRPLSRSAILGGEDCLYLNVWRPRSEETGLPVYVWIHGGGNSIGSASMVPDYYGNRLAAVSNAVFVSVNYRLGPMGWFAHPALAEGESAEDGSGNYGTLDLIHALRWVRDNIDAFGGDPGRVLIAGESAGGMNVLSLMISPLARGLFSHAVVESGAAMTRGMEEAYRSADRVLVDLLLRDRRARSRAGAEELARRMAAAEIATYLRSKTDREIMRCFPTATLGMVSNPAILRDGAVIPADGYAAIDRGAHADVPLIIGSNKEETKLFLFFNGKLRRNQPLYQAVAKWGSDRWKAGGVDGVARRLAGSPGRSPVYVYQFRWGALDAEGSGPLPGGWGKLLGSFHSLEIPFFLGTSTVFGKYFTSILFTSRNEVGREALSAAIMGYVARFVRTGDPGGGSELPRWLPWSNESGAVKCIIFDARGDEPAIEMSELELDTAGVDEVARRDLDPALYERAARVIADFSAAVRSDP